MGKEEEKGNTKFCLGIKKMKEESSEKLALIPY